MENQQEEGHAEVGKIIRFICGKSIVVFHCQELLPQLSLLVARLLQSAVPVDQYTSYAM